MNNLLFVVFPYVAATLAIVVTIMMPGLTMTAIIISIAMVSTGPGGSRCNQGERHGHGDKRTGLVVQRHNGLLVVRRCLLLTPRPGKR